MIKTMGTPEPGMMNILICTDASELTSASPVVANYKDDKGNVIESGLPCADTSLAIVPGNGVKWLMNGAWM